MLPPMTLVNNNCRFEHFNQLQNFKQILELSVDFDKLSTVIISILSSNQPIFVKKRAVQTMIKALNYHGSVTMNCRQMFEKCLIECFRFEGVGDSLLAKFGSVVIR